MKDILIAHRGEPENWPENSLPGYQAVLEAGAPDFTPVATRADDPALDDAQGALGHFQLGAVVTADVGEPALERSVNRRLGADLRLHLLEGEVAVVERQRLRVLVQLAREAAGGVR